MKKIFIVLITVALTSGCYEDYIEDFDYSSVYFAYQENARTLVAGEGMEIKIGVTLAGVRENNQERSVSYAIDPTLLDGTDYTLIPAAYYSLSGSDMVIPVGMHQGEVNLIGNIASINADPDMLPAGTQKYALPLTITSVSGIDTVLQTKKSTIIPLLYEHTLYGNYRHSGTTIVKAPDGSEIKKITYSSEVNDPEGAIWKLSTMSTSSVMAKGVVPDLDGNNFDVNFQIALEDAALGISAIDGSPYAVSGEGSSTFNKAEKLEERLLFVNYMYEKDGNMWHATDTLIFRNRIRDGVNEWQGFGATVR